MINKLISALAVAVLFCAYPAISQAKESMPKDSANVNFIKKSILRNRIDTISLSKREKELGSSLIRELLHDQLSPFRRQMRENHNAYVQAYINKYTRSNFQGHLSRMKGLASYYFPIFEKVFHETHVPSEIKYLAI